MTGPPPLNYSTVTNTVLSNTRDNSSKQDYRNYSGIYHRHEDDMASVAKKTNRRVQNNNGLDEIN